jgi:hypothetical protein
LALNKKALPLYGVKQKNLNEFCTTQKDCGKGVSRMPLEMARIHEDGSKAGAGDEKQETAEDNIL